MVIAGPCLYNLGDDAAVESTHIELSKTLGRDWLFRCKLWGGGTRVDRWEPGRGADGIPLLERLGNSITEVHTPEHVERCWNLAGVWIGARNSSNYSLLAYACKHPGIVMIKRGAGMSIKEIENLAILCEEKFKKRVYVIERGINTRDQNEDWGRWTPDIKIAYVWKAYKQELFDRLVADCSHSAGNKEFIADIYKAYKAIGVKNFMFETFEGAPRTDKNQNLRVKELRIILDKRLRGNSNE